MKKIAALILALSLFSSLGASAEVISGIAAVVNEEVITLLELNREFATALKMEEKRSGRLASEDADKLKKLVLDSMVDKLLVRQKIKELNIVISEEEVRQSIEDIKKQNKMSQESLSSALLSQGITFDQYKAQMRDQLERLRLMSQEVKSKIQVSERELREYYDNNRSQYLEEPTYRARHIFLKVDKKATNQEIKKIMQRATDISAEARGSVDFIELAKKHSDDPGAKTDGGDLGTFKKGDMMPELEAAIIAMNPGEISDLVSTTAGFHIIKLEEKSPEKLKPFDSVKTAIDDLLYRKKSEERFKQWAEELRKNAAVDIKKQALQRD